MTAHRHIGQALCVGLLLVTPLMLLGAALCGCPAPRADAATAPNATAAAMPAMPVPRCIHETCGERPKYLKCNGSWGAAGCGGWEILYEHHCDCDTWAAAVDGGAK